MKQIRGCKEPNKRDTHKCKKCGEGFRLKYSLIKHKCQSYD